MEPCPREAVLGFWFNHLDPKDWFKKSERTDAEIRARFLKLTEELLRTQAAGWDGTPDDRLAAILVLDQFTRNIFRGTARAFAGDAAALSLARAAIDAGDLEREVDTHRKLFVLMPLEHAEDLATQVRCVELMESLPWPADADYADYARRHRDVIARFGRFPHRNALLGRANTPEEEAFLSEPGSRF